MAGGGPVAAELEGGRRLHLQHGPIDLIIGAEGAAPGARARAFQAAAARFETVLQGVVAELSRHRAALSVHARLPEDPTAARMYRAARPFAAMCFVTPMSAVAGAVADEVLAAMCAAVPLSRAYVNNGGDIALHLTEGARFDVAMAHELGTDLGRVQITGADGVGGIATSGAGGRSLSLGIADSVTVLAGSAAEADVAATLIANAVDLPGHGAITRVPAHDLHPDSDLGARAVVTGVGALTAPERARALASGLARARAMQDAGQIIGAALFLQGHCAQSGAMLHRTPLMTEPIHDGAYS